jgi:hypothetical protein
LPLAGTRPQASQKNQGGTKMNINKEIREMTNKELIEVIESQDFWNSDERRL